MAIELRRTHKGEVVLHVNGQPASAAKFNGVSTLPDGTQHAVFVIPMQHCTLGEMDNVVAFRPRKPIKATPTGHVT